MVNVVLIGLKGHQGSCVQEIAQRDGVQLVGIADDDPKALEGLRRHSALADGAVLTPNVDEVLALEDVQVAILAEDNASRPDNLIACAGRGWHIVAEKPLALSLDDLARVKRAVDDAGVRLSMLMTMRFEGLYRTVRRAIADGAVGEPLQLAGQKSYRRGTRPAWQQDHATFGGTIPFIGIHLIDLLRWTTGREPVRVAATQRNFGLPGAGTIEEIAGMVFELDNGGLEVLRLDYLRPAQAPTHGDDRLRIAGSEGVLESMGGQITLLRHDAEPRTLEPEETGSLFGDFLDALAGQGEHAISAADCFRLTEISLKAREAAERGTWIDC